MAFQQYNSAQAANIITNWHTDDDLSDEEEQEDDEDFNQFLLLLDQEMAGVRLAVVQTVLKAANLVILILILPILTQEQQLLVIQLCWEGIRRCGKVVEL